MELSGVGTSAAKRRRERPLRSWWRHECQSVRMALTPAAHHSAEKVAAGGTHSGLRAQTTVSAGRPDVFEDPKPQVRAATVGYVAAAAPLLAQPVLVGGDTLDTAVVQFLLAQTLLMYQREEVKVAKEEAEEKAMGETKLKAMKEAEFEEKMLIIKRKMRDGLPCTPGRESAWRCWIGITSKFLLVLLWEEEEEEEEAEKEDEAVILKFSDIAQ